MPASTASAASLIACISENAPTSRQFVIRDPGRPARSAAADLRDQHDLAAGVERLEVGVLKDLAVDRHRHRLVDLPAEPGKAALEFGNHAAHGVGFDLDLALPAGEP